MHTKPVTFTIPAPAAGADWTYEPSNGDQAVIMAITARLTTAVAVANRLPALTLKDQNGTVYFADDMSEPQAASLVCRYSWAREAPDPLAVALSNNQSVTAPFPNVWLQPGDTIGTVTQNIQAADQWSTIVIRYYTGEHWRHLQHELREIADLERTAVMLGA